MDAGAGPSRSLRRAAKEILKDHAYGAAVGIAVLWILPGWLRCGFIFLVSLILLSSIITPFIENWKPKGKISADGKAVVISGCDSGFGHMLAQRLDDVGYQVFAGCLFPEGDGAQNLKKSSSNRLHVVGLDVTKDESVQNLLAYVTENLKDNVLWAVVCNAGINDGAQLLWTSFETVKKVLEVNLFGVIRVTKAFLPQLCQNKGGRVVCVASAAGRVSAAGMVPYCMSKHGVVSFCDGLRQEMYQFGVQVTSIEPWMFKTPITEEQSTVNYIKRAWDTAPEEVKLMYSPNFIEDYVKGTLFFLNFSKSNSPSEVVSCMEEAVTAKYPKYSYMPGTLYSRASYWILRKLPKQIEDFLFLSAFRQAI